MTVGVVIGVHDGLEDAMAITFITKGEKGDKGDKGDLGDKGT